MEESGADKEGSLSQRSLLKCIYTRNKKNPRGKVEKVQILEGPKCLAKRLGFYPLSVGTCF